MTRTGRAKVRESSTQRVTLVNKILLVAVLLAAPVPAFALEPSPLPGPADEAALVWFGPKQPVARAPLSLPLPISTVAVSIPLPGATFESREQSAKPATGRTKARRDAWYVSWGYNTERYARTDIQFTQQGKGNDFTLKGVKLHDSQGWDLWNHGLTVPQYSFRFGRFISRNTAIELNFDHAKAVATPEHDQAVQMSGTLAGIPVEKQVLLSGILQKYKLNNGANFVLVNIVRRLPLVREPGATGSIAALGKAGFGFTVPHTENTVLGEANDAGFHYGGLGAGLEGAIRVHLLRNLYFEGAQKGFYGAYRNIKIRDGKARHGLWAYVTIVSLGVSF